MSTETSPSSSLTPRQREWLDHLRAWRREGGTLKAYAVAHDLSVSALYTARRSLGQRGAWPARPNDVVDTPTAKLVPVRLTPVSSMPPMLRVVLPNGVVVEVPEQVDPVRCRALLACVSEVLR